MFIFILIILTCLSVIPSVYQSYFLSVCFANFIFIHIYFLSFFASLFLSFYYVRCQDIYNMCLKKFNNGHSCTHSHAEHIVKNNLNLLLKMSQPRLERKQWYMSGFLHLVQKSDILYRCIWSNRDRFCFNAQIGIFLGQCSFQLEFLGTV